MYKRTKIVCTMGPACDSDETIREMIKAGMNVARFNFSHGSYDEHHGRIERVRRISKELGLPVGILLDTKGPEVRTGLLVDGKKVAVKTGDKIVVTAQPTSEDFHGTAEHISLDYLALPSEVEKGSLILIDDGLVALEVESVSGQDMTCVVKNDGLIGERKGVNMPNVNISLPAITERDRQDILFGLTENIDYIAASFIRDGESVRGIRELCRENGGEHVTIFPKIECALGVENFDEILEASDGIMVAVATWVSRSSPSSFRTSRRRSSPSATRPTSPLSPLRRCSTPCSRTRARRAPRLPTLLTPFMTHRRRHAVRRVRCR